MSEGGGDSLRLVFTGCFPRLSWNVFLCPLYFLYTAGRELWKLSWIQVQVFGETAVWGVFGSSLRDA